MTSEQFRAALRELGISQRWLAHPKQMHLAASTVSKWATGKAPVPRYAEFVIELLRDRRARKPSEPPSE